MKVEPRKAPFSFMNYYNCGGKEHSMKSCISASRTVSKKIKKKTEAADKRKKMVRIIDDDKFTKVVNTQRTLSPMPGPAPKTPIPEPRMVELVSD